jgi:hypothetical protein
MHRSKQDAVSYHMPPHLIYRLSDDKMGIYSLKVFSFSEHLKHCCVENLLDRLLIIFI